MIEAKLLVGRFLTITVPPARAVTGNPAAFVNVVCPPLRIEESHRKVWHKSGIRESNVLPGANPGKLHRNFKWLPWYKGDISETDLTVDVLTGPMSGCILVTYLDATGALKAGHVGTVDNAVPNYVNINNNVKGVWNAFANLPGSTVLGGFNPVAITVPAHPPAQPGDTWGQTWGLYTTNGLYYAVQVWQQAGNVNSYRVAAVHQVPSLTLAQLQAL